MGAQQVKSQNELLILHRDKQQLISLEKGSIGMTSQSSERKLTDEIYVKKIMSKESFNLAHDSEGSISVTDFAKIKTEPRSAEEYLNDQTELVDKDLEESVICGNINAFVSTHDNLEPVVNISVSSNENGLELISAPSASDILNVSNIEVKKELLESHGVKSDLQTFIQNDVTLESNTHCLTPNDDESSREKSNEVCSEIKTETTDHSLINEIWNNSKNVQTNTDKDKLIQPDNSNGKDNNQQPTNKSNLVINPLAFFKKRCNKIAIKKHKLIEKRIKEHCLNTIIKSEPILLDADLVIERSSKSPKPFKTNENEIIIKEEAVQSSIHLNELIIKSENVVSEVNQEIYNNSESSLDVNLSNVETDFDEAICTHSIEKVTSTDDNNTTKYFSMINVSSEENYDLPVQKAQLEIMKQNPKKQTSHKINTYRTYKTTQKRNLKCSTQERGPKQIKCVFKTVGRKRKSKSIHAKKITEKDSVYNGGLSKRDILKKLPKTGIKTRKKSNKPIARNKIPTNKEEFPKPLKLEPDTIHKEGKIATKLPKPIKFKSELNINNKNLSYLRPQFQPLVRLKRLKSEELLMPLKTKHRRKIGKFKSATSAVNCLNYHQMANDNRQDFHIHQAFSLHPCIKLNRLSVDQDQSYCHNQPSLSSHPTTQYSNPNESLAETESKYFSPQELFSLFHSSTPDSSSMFSGQLDSGISTSTPSISQHSQGNNKTLLLKIAAERAFINYHLMHFGYSQMQFDLYNNLNELNVFLKYLLGSRNTF